MFDIIIKLMENETLISNCPYFDEIRQLKFTFRTKEVIFQTWKVHISKQIPLRFIVWFQWK